MKGKKADRRKHKLLDEGGQPLSGKTIRTGSYRQQKQYPPVVGYHGTDDEKDLNPEE